MESAEEGTFWEQLWEGRKPLVTDRSRLGREWTAMVRAQQSGSRGTPGRCGGWCGRNRDTGRPASGSCTFQYLKMAGSIVLCWCWDVVCLFVVLFPPLPPPIPFGLKWVLLRKARPLGFSVVCGVLKIR